MTNILYLMAMIFMLSHLIEFRARLMQCLVFFSIVFIFFFIFAPEFFTTLMTPLLNALPQHGHLIATHITSPLLTPLKLAAQSALFCSMPFFLYHVWRFVAPGLYQHERYFFALVLCMSFILFIIGALFCFFGVLPWMFYMMSMALPKGVEFLPDMESAFEFITHFIFIFGVCFQIPLLCIVLVRSGHVSLQNLVLLRPYVIVMAFIVGMLLTPPDVLSQILLALPLWGLFESGILLAKCFAPRSSHRLLR